MKKNKNLIFLIISIFLLFLLLKPNLQLFSVTSNFIDKRIPFINLNSNIPSVMVGDLQITTYPISFVCKSEISTLTPETRTVFSGGKDVTSIVYVPSFSGTITIPNPRSDCWKTSMDWGKQPFSFVAGQKININKFVNITFDERSGSFVTFGVEKISYEPRDMTGKIIGSTIREWVTSYGVFKNPEDEKRLFWFEVDPSFLQLRWKEGSNILRIGSNDNPTLIVNNDLIDNLKGELLIKIHKTITKEERVISIPVTLNKNEKEYQINLPKETLGGLITEAKLSVDFLGVKIFSKNTIKRTFNVIPNIYYNGTFDILKDNIEITESKENLFTSPKQIEQSSANSFILIIFLAIILMLLFKLVKKNGTPQ